MSQSRAFAFTLAEMLVVLGILLVMFAMAIPAMQNMREISRRSNCQKNLAELSLAIAAYRSQYRHFPIGTINDQGPIRSVAEGFHHNWISGLLPMMDLMPLYQAIDRDVSVYAPANAPVRRQRMSRLLCPSATKIRENTTCYAGLHASAESAIDSQNDGIFILNVPIGESDVPDGLAFTLMLGEKLSRVETDLGWLSGTRSSLRNTGHSINEDRAAIRAKPDPDVILAPTFVGGFLSDHPDGAYGAMASGEVRFLSESIDRNLLKQMGGRRDGVSSSPDVATTP